MINCNLVSGVVLFESKSFFCIFPIQNQNVTTVNTNRLRLAITFLSLLLICTQAYAQDAIDQIQDRGEIKIGLTGTQPPFSMQAKDGSVMGFEVDLAVRLGNAMGVKTDLVQMPFADLLTALEKGDVDIVMSGMTITSNRNIKVAFMGPYMVSGKSILTKSSVLKTVTSAPELNQDYVKLATLKGSTSESFAERNLPQAKLSVVDNYDEGIEMVRNGSIDALLADYSICAYTILRHPEEGFLTLNRPLTLEPIGVAYPPHDIHLSNFLENFFNILQLNGDLAALEEKWFRNGEWLDRVK